MICKECGAYNPDHATYCKVCAANLKGEPEVEAPEMPAEDLQPTKRFSRPSWVVAEQPVKKESSTEDAEEAEPAAKDEIEEVPEEPVEASVPETNASEPVDEDPDDDDPDSYETRSEHPIWTPTRSRRRTIEPADEDDEDDDYEEESKEPEEEGIYNEEEALDQDDDSFEYEPTPPKRKSSKKKGNTLFTVLLISIIVVIVAILVFGGIYLLQRLGVLNCGNSGEGTSFLSCSGARETTADTTNPPTTDATPDPSASTGGENEPDEKTATLLEYVNDAGEDYVAITVLVPAHGSMTIDFPHQDDYKATNDKDVAYPRRVNIPVQIFYPNAPLDTPTQTITPSISVTKSDGTSYDVECPSFTKNFPPLSIALTAPLAKEDGSYMAAEGNVIHLEGKVDDFDVTLKINGVATNVYEGGVFMQDYTMTSDTAETIELVATKNNYVTATTTLTVDPYVFVPDPMVLEVKDDIASLRADKSGKLTVVGTTLPGATLTATSDNTTRVLCGTVTVDAEGKFSFGITMDTDFYGISTITLNATKEGAEDGSTTFIVSRAHADKDTFVKWYNKGSKYIEINRKTMLTEILASLDTYSGNEYGFRLTGTVSEIINEGDMTIIKMTLVKTNEIVYVQNFSSKWTPQDNIGGKYNVYGNLVGTYQDTGCALFIGWFAKKQ